MYCQHKALGGFKDSCVDIYLYEEIHFKEDEEPEQKY